jgi:D-beta-D-heptose 7-phosphate kinase/D-beta-D-heptose 1-phosphate adenosyltransferase
MTPDRVAELFDAVANVRALVIGDLILDRYVSGVVDRVSPEAPVPVVRVERESSAIGGASNVAANVTALGASCAVVGCAGQDAAGQTLKAELEMLGVETEGIVFTDSRPTTVKTRVLSKHQQIVRFDHEVDADVDESLATALAEAVIALALEADVVIMEDYNKGVLVPTVIRAAREAAAARGAPTIADPKRRNFFEYGGVTVFKPNAKELEDALGEFIHPDDAGWMEATRHRLACDNLLLTLGERGVALQSRESGFVRVATAARAVYDVSGAGDTVTAVVALVLAAGGTPTEAAVLANHAAAVEVGKAGVATVSPAEIAGHVLAHADS